MAIAPLRSRPAWATRRFSDCNRQQISTQAWFDYGIKLYHAFYHDDAKLAFDKAVVADPHCAMCLWGQALSRGPVMNFDVDETNIKAGLEIARHAQAVARRAAGPACSRPQR